MNLLYMALVFYVTVGLAICLWTKFKARREKHPVAVYLFCLVAWPFALLVVLCPFLEEWEL